jgi:hypothetical protein
MTARAAGRVAALVVVLLAVTGCEPMRRGSEGAYRHAVADGATAELARLGVRMRRSPDCTTSVTPVTSQAAPGTPGPGGGTLVRVRCTGRTTNGARVEVSGHATRAETARPRESYTISVDGREIVRKPCLGAGCRPSRR